MNRSHGDSWLRLRQCTLRFGGLTAVSELDLDIPPASLVGLIGPNGAGKTTVFNLVTGVYHPTSGNIEFQDRSISRLQPHQIARRGISRTFQNIRLFPSLSVFDNVRVALQLHSGITFGHSLGRTGTFYKREEQLAAEGHKLLTLFHLDGVSDLPARSLSYGDQRRLEIVRALATRPKLLLLDEPAAGMNPAEKSELMRLIKFVKDEFQLAILLVEHDMHVVMGICQRITVLDYGLKIAEGSPEEVRQNPKVIEAYLGN